MTLVVGHSFDAFANSPLSNRSRSDKDRYLHGMSLAALELAALELALWQVPHLPRAVSPPPFGTGEYNVMVLKKRVYDAVMHKDTLWFDTRRVMYNPPTMGLSVPVVY
jgi:ATP-binding cassette subfamily B (MDR/TAP) protein 1